MQVLNKIRFEISKGNMSLALDHLWKNFNNSSFQDEAIIVKSRFESLQDKMIAGVLSPSDITLEENRISYSLLGLLNKIQEAGTEANLENVDRKLSSKALIEKLLEILEETYEGFQAQAEIRNQLYRKLKSRLSIEDHLEYEDFFHKYHASMNEEEVAHHESIREFTEKILNQYNRKALELILGNEELKSNIPRLHELERHLFVWIGKFETDFKAKPSISLVYVGVKEKVPFPPGIERELKEYLESLN
ncbi:MAG: hypothetical protein AAFY36_12510 [Bacteroidota bacterium]